MLTFSKTPLSVGVYKPLGSSDSEHDYSLADGNDNAEVSTVSFQIFGDHHIHF
jgi:hypothetical protein